MEQVSDECPGVCASNRPKYQEPDSCTGCDLCSGRSVNESRWIAWGPAKNPAFEECKVVYDSNLHTYTPRSGSACHIDAHIFDQMGCCKPPDISHDNTAAAGCGAT